LDHEELFSLTSKLTGGFLMTYDDAEGVKHLAEKHDMKYESIAMKNTHHNKMMELLIGKNLDWLFK
jgi:DNA adenine methylase